MLRYEIRIAKREGFELYAGRFDEEFEIKYAGKMLLLTNRKNMLEILNKIKTSCKYGETGWCSGDVVCGARKETIEDFIQEVTNFGANPCW